MNWLIGLRVKTKLIGGFLIVAVIAAIIGAVGINSTSQVNAMATRMYEYEMLGMNHAGSASTQFASLTASVRGALLALSMSDRKQELQRVDERIKKTKAELDFLDDLFVSEAGKALVRQTREGVLAYEAAVGRLIAVLHTEPPGGAVDSLEILARDARPLAEAASALMGKLVAGKLNNAEGFAKEITVVYGNTQLLLIALTVGGALLAILLGIVIAAYLARQLGGEPRDAARAAGAIASGDLTHQIDMSKAGEGSVIYAMHSMQESLRTVVDSVRASSDSIATGSNQIAVGNTDLSQRTEEQAANLTQTAAAMEELTSTVKSNADVAQQAAQLAESASAAAQKGGEVSSEMIVTMQEINDASRKIVDIISVIDGIAFQTNILALNAAVEAARAGEQGRGFAVVATEVRTLAQRSASAAKDIKNLIDDTVAKVDDGTKLVGATGESMSGIVTQVQHVTDLINEISAATKEQTTGLAQINDAVMQLSDVTQQNAALVEESASAADSLNDQAQKLVEVVGVFKVGQERSIARRTAVDHGQATRRAGSAAAALPRVQPQPLAQPKPRAAAKSDYVSPNERASLAGARNTARAEEWEEF